MAPEYHAELVDYLKPGVPDAEKESAGKQIDFLGFEGVVINRLGKLMQATITAHDIKHAERIAGRIANNFTRPGVDSFEVSVTRTQEATNS